MKVSYKKSTKQAGKPVENNFVGEGAVKNEATHKPKKPVIKEVSNLVHVAPIKMQEHGGQVVQPSDSNTIPAPGLADEES